MFSPKSRDASLTGSHNTEKLEEMTELERLQAENAVLKKMRELRIVVFGSIIRGFSG